MLGMNWLKRKLKKNMTPLQRPYAAKMSRQLSFIYAFLGWNFVAVLIYMTFKSHIPEGPGKSKQILFFFFCFYLKKYSLNFGQKIFCFFFLQIFYYFIRN